MDNNTLHSKFRDVITTTENSVSWKFKMPSRYWYSLSTNASQLMQLSFFMQAYTYTHVDCLDTLNLNKYIAFTKPPQYIFTYVRQYV